MNQSKTNSLLQQALGYINNNQLDEAHNALLLADQNSPGNIEVYHLLSVVFGMVGDYQQSEHYCKKAIAINNMAFVVYNNLGSAQKLLGKYSEAEQSFQQVIKLNPNYIDAYVNLANLYIEIEKIEEAKTLVNTASGIDKNNLGLIMATGNLRLKQDNNAEAIKHYQLALSVQPHLTDALINLGQIHEHAGDTEAALKYYYQVLELIPGYDQSIIGIASILEKKGQFDEALTLIEPVIENSQNMKLHIVCARIYSRKEEYSETEKLLLKAKSMVANDQYQQELLFEFGNIYDKQARYDEAFSAYKQANEINRESFDCDKSTRFFDDVKRVYAGELLEQIAESGVHSIQPVFIVGMPRSGTSLVEQILASHSEVYGAGELELIDDILHQLESEHSSTPYPDWVSRLTTSKLNNKADYYIDQISQLSANSTYITNKMPHNFLHLGFIQKLFPKAKIIHCTRNPKDTALSIYFHQFNNNHPYARTLTDLSFYYQQYRDLMSHWQNELKLEMTTVNYETLIANPEQECRKLIDFFNLDWEDACLKFHNNKRVVNTPSYHQVRKPLYNNAVNRHQHYDKYMVDFE